MRETSERRALRLRRVVERSLLVFGGVVVALLILEAAVHVGYRAIRGERLPLRVYRSLMLEQAATSDTPSGRGSKVRRGGEVIHPYLGFVPDPDQRPDRLTTGDSRLVPPRNDRELIVGVFGGSFAEGLCAHGEEVLRNALTRPTKSARVVCMAVGGYKQPQQLLALTYLLAQGARFDVVINVDGFNEVALAPVENAPQRVAPIYPRGWFWRVGELDDPGALKLLGELAGADRARRHWAGFCAGWGFYRSSLLAAVWRSQDRFFESKRNRILTELSEHEIEQRRSYAATGPEMTFTQEGSLDGYLARVWKDSSLQMKAICDANGITYVHFLQPNQYVEGSKPMRPQERKLAIKPARYAASVVRAYPLLRRAGDELRSVGVRFHDLTMVFEDVEEPLYSDSCCHLTPAGYARIAHVIGDSVGRDAGQIR